MCFFSRKKKIFVGFLFDGIGQFWKIVATRVNVEQCVSAVLWLSFLATGTTCHYTLCTFVPWYYVFEEVQKNVSLARKNLSIFWQLRTWIIFSPTNCGFTNNRVWVCNFLTLHDFIEVLWIGETITVLRKNWSSFDYLEHFPNWLYLSQKC